MERKKEKKKKAREDDDEEEEEEETQRSTNEHLLLTSAHFPSHSSFLFCHSFSVGDRCHFAALLTVAMQQKPFDSFQLLRVLLSEVIDKAVKKQVLL